MVRPIFFLAVTLSVLVLSAAQASDSPLYLIRAAARNQAQRNKIANLGLALEGIQSDSVLIFGSREEAKKIADLGIKVEYTEIEEEKDFPNGDGAYHTYASTLAEIDTLVRKYPDLATRFTMGKSYENRDLAGIRISSNPKADSLPTSIFMGCHHAREHLSVEFPILLAKYLAENYEKNERIHDLLDKTEVYIIPMVNPDGAEYDISGGKYHYWRKNRRTNGDGSRGVDLNRNYGPDKLFGGQGSSDSPSSDVYHGPTPFSEPETAAVRDFVRARKKATTLLTLHAFSELVMWPYSGTNDDIANATDLKVFEVMGKKMASWNHYTPEKSSAMYVAMGDTGDWAYEELKIFAFTFEMSPKSYFAGGFYPGAKAIQPTFEANLEPALYLIEKSQNPYGVVAKNFDPLGIVR